MPITQILLTANSSQGGGGGGGGGGGPDYSFPVSGSGMYFPDASTLGYSGTTNTGLYGTAYDPGSGVDVVPNIGTGLIRRRIETGNLGGIAGIPGAGPFATPGNVVNTAVDLYGGFGFINAPDQENYAIEWLGYWQAPLTANYNFVIHSDDRAWFWIGNNAIAGTFFWSNPHVSSDNGTNINANSVSVISGKYYPIRMWFQEFSGAEYCQIYAGLENTTPLAMTQYALRHNTATMGH